MNEESAPSSIDATNASWWTAENRAAHSARMREAIERSRREASAPNPGAVKPQRLLGESDARKRERAKAHAALVDGIWSMVRARPVRAEHLYDIGRQIRRYRAQTMSLIDLADAAGLSEADMLAIERGCGYMLTPEIIAIFCEELEVPPTFLLTYTSDKWRQR